MRIEDNILNPFLNQDEGEPGEGEVDSGEEKEEEKEKQFQLHP